MSSLHRMAILEIAHIHESDILIRGPHGDPGISRRKCHLFLHCYEVTSKHRPSGKARGDALVSSPYRCLHDPSLAACRALLGETPCCLLHPEIPSRPLCSHTQTRSRNKCLYFLLKPAVWKELLNFSHPSRTPELPTQGERSYRAPAPRSWML